MQGFLSKQQMNKKKKQISGLIEIHYYMILVTRKINVNKKINKRKKDKQKRLGSYL